MSNTLDALERQLEDGARTSMFSALERQQEQSRSTMQTALREMRAMRAQLEGSARRQQEQEQELRIARGLLGELVEVGLADEASSALERAEQYLVTVGVYVHSRNRGRAQDNSGGR